MLLSLTFLTGLAIGMYVYIVAFKPTYVPEDLGGTEAAASEWSMVGKRFATGPSGYVQPSFRLLGDGQYVYLPGGMDDSAPTPIEGRISRGLMREVRAADPRVPGYAAGASPELCSGQGYEYQITITGATYLLGPCLAAVDAGYAAVLERVWLEIEGPEPGRRYDSFADWAEDWIRRNVGVE